MTKNLEAKDPKSDVPQTSSDGLQSANPQVSGSANTVTQGEAENGIGQLLRKIESPDSDALEELKWRLNVLETEGYAGVEAGSRNRLLVKEKNLKNILDDDTPHGAGNSRAAR